MPRTANNTDALLKDLQGRLATLVDTAKAEGRQDALDQVKALVGPSPKRSRKASSNGNGAPKKKKRRNGWPKKGTPEHLARVNAIRKGRGLPEVAAAGA